MPTTAVEFWDRFCPAVEERKPTGVRRAWTQGMYDVLHKVQEQLGLRCQCTAHPKASTGGSHENLKLDFTWFAPHPHLSLEEQQWVPIDVAIEHENVWKPFARSLDHWKVNQIGAYLRVFIGYVGKDEQVDQAASALMAREDRWFSVPGGQTLIIIGNCTQDYRFRAWWTRQGVRAWIELPRMRP